MNDSEVVYLGYTRGELRLAFDRVADKANWKNPIDATIPLREVAVTMAAIVFFAGSTSTATNAPGDAAYLAHITAPGYYVAVGA